MRVQEAPTPAFTSTSQRALLPVLRVFVGADWEQKKQAALPVKGWLMRTGVVLPARLHTPSVPGGTKQTSLADHLHHLPQCLDPQRNKSLFVFKHH